MTHRRLDFGCFSLDAERGELMRQGTAPVNIGRRAAALLQRLLQAEGRLVAKAELIDFAWPGAVIEDSNLSVQIAALRKALDQGDGAGRWIVTVPRIGYRFAGPPVAETVVAARAATPNPDSDRRPSIAVLPLANLSGDTGQQYFADAVTEEIITALTRFRWFHVLGRNVSFRLGGAATVEAIRELGIDYLLEGSVQRSSSEVRIAARLLEAASGRLLWGDRFELEAGESFAVQDRIATAVAAAAEPELLKSESAVAARRRRLGSESALDVVYQGMWLFHRVGRDTHLRARTLFRQALELDPELPEANVWLGRVNAGIVAYGWSSDVAADLAEGVAAAEHAVRLDERNPYAHYALAITTAYTREFERSARASRAALAVNPSFALGHLVLGMAELYAGRPETAVEAFGRGLELNPHDPQNFVWLDLLALAWLFLGDPAEAQACAERSLVLRPGWCVSNELLACARATLNDIAGARAALAATTDHDRPLSALIRPLLESHPAWRRRMATLLQRAQLPLAVAR
jgi:TolB-like protein